MPQVEHNWRGTEDWRALWEYLRLLADLVGLRDWTVHLMHYSPTDDDANASVVPLEGRKHANVYVAAHWRDLNDTDRRHALVHELVHCHGAPMYEMVRLDLLRHMSQATYDVFQASYRRMAEYQTDGLADVLAPHMPPYPKPEAVADDDWSI